MMTPLYFVLAATKNHINPAGLPLDFCLPSLMWAQSEPLFRSTEKP